MCQLNTLYCKELDAVGLLNREGGHHPFVYGQSDTFPECAVRHLETVGLDPERYRRLVIEAREQNLVRFSQGTHYKESGAYVTGKSASIRRPAHVTDAWWGSRRDMLQRERMNRVLTSLWHHIPTQEFAGVFAYLFPSEWKEFKDAHAERAKILASVRRKARQKVFRRSKMRIQNAIVALRNQVRLRHGEVRSLLCEEPAVELRVPKREMRALALVDA